MSRYQTTSLPTDTDEEPKFKPLKYHYKDGFISVPLWDADFLRHKASGYILDFRYLQTITVYDDFVALCNELEAFENK